MRLFLLLLVAFEACDAGRLQILPNNTPLDDQSSLDSNSLYDFNKKLFGFKGSNDSQKLPSENLFGKPKALVIITLKGLENFTYDGQLFNFTDAFESDRIRQNFEQQFGDDMIRAEVNSSGIFGSHFKRDVKSNEIHIASEYEAIRNMDKLAEVIRQKDRKNANVVDYYRIHLDVSNARSELEKKQLEENIKQALDTVLGSVKNSTGSQVVNVEIYTHSDPDEKAEYRRVKKFQKKYLVTRARHIDYAADFAITMFVCLSIVLAAASMVWFMIDDSDMSKNSLVYRLSTARPKKD